jgi:prepilin-type N-terminal cleavage/methylation domain-containing protein
MAICEGKNRISGFTPIEVIVVLVIIGIISIMIIGRSDFNQPDLFAQAEVVRSHIRYTQSRAMNSDRSWGLRFNDTGQSYWLFHDGNINDRRRLPGEESDVVDLSVYRLVLTPASTTLSFDDRGRPCSDDGGDTPLANDLIVNLSAGGGVSQLITVTRNTGFVP